MKLTKFMRGSVTALVCCGMLSAQLAQAAGPQTVQASRSAMPAHAAIRDVALGNAGVLRGHVVDGQGAPRGAVPVAVVRQGQPVAQTQTDANGQFAVQGLTGGIYEVVTPDGVAMYRAWSPNTAPPSATQEVIVAPNELVVRGQAGYGGALGWLANPWVLAGIVAAAIAIPLALDDDDAS